LQAGPHPADILYSTKLTTEHVFENFGGNCPVALPLIAGSAARLVSITLHWFSNFHELRSLSKDSQHLWPPAHQ